MLGETSSSLFGREGLNTGEIQELANVIQREPRSILRSIQRCTGLSEEEDTKLTQQIAHYQHLNEVARLGAGEAAKLELSREFGSSKRDDSLMKQIKALEDINRTEKEFAESVAAEKESERMTAYENRKNPLRLLATRHGPVAGQAPRFGKANGFGIRTARLACSPWNPAAVKRIRSMPMRQPVSGMEIDQSSIEFKPSSHAAVRMHADRMREANNKILDALDKFDIGTAD